MKGYYTVAEVCALFNVSRATIDRWEEKQGFPERVRLSNHPKGRCGFPIEEVEAWDTQRRESRGRDAIATALSE
jgi:predicted DNA-binding transcriptional regulator AlpA